MGKIAISGAYRLLVAVFSVLVISGCYVSVHPNMGLYPVQGPLMAEPPVREGHVKFAAHVILTPVYFSASKSGEMTATLGDGEICKGRWKWIPTPAENPTASDWDAIYGQGFYVAQVLGTRQYLQAELAGDRGTMLHVEIYWPESGDPDRAIPGRGVATDNHGNVYKVAQQY